jgi:acetyl esterase/lipase
MQLQHHLHGRGSPWRWRRTASSRLSSYRLAPEAPYPAALDDAYAGLVWLVQHAGKLGIDPGRIVVEGISAGGGLAAATAIRARDEGGPAILGNF